MPVKFGIFVKNSLLFNSFYCLFCLQNKTLRLKNLNKTAIYANISVFAICVDGIMYWLLYDLHDCTFNDITKGLNTKKWYILNKSSDDRLVNAIRKYENHQSIIKIKSSVETTQLFDFDFVNSDNISKIINSLDPTKKTSGAIPTKTVKLANKQICKDLGNCINDCLKQNKFPNKLKIADITHIFKKEYPLDMKPIIGF